jgi:hypothetical protein
MTLLSKEEFSLVEIKDVKLGSTQVKKIYCGNDLVFENIIDNIPPVTTVYPSPEYTYLPGQLVWLEVDEACTTYYTEDGSTPTTSSAIFKEVLRIYQTTTLKYFSVDMAGNVESVKTTVWKIQEDSENPTVAIVGEAIVGNSTVQ